MKKILMTTAASLLISGAALAENVNIGIILGFTGPIESLTVDMGAGAELAIVHLGRARTLWHFFV